jgi:hypothetical protein
VPGTAYLYLEGAPLQTQERSSTLAKGRVSPIDRESILSADLVDHLFSLSKMENAKEDNAESRLSFNTGIPSGLLDCRKCLVLRFRDMIRSPRFVVAAGDGPGRVKV